VPQPKERSLRFTRVRLENWRNFTHADVPLQKRAFLVGPNASGKSNFLDAFRFLRDIAAPGGGLSDAVARRGGVSRVRALAARHEPVVSLAVGIGDDDNPSAWGYEIAFVQDGRQRPTVERECVTKDGEVLLDRPDAMDAADPERLTQTHLEQVLANQQFRGITEFLASVQYLHLVPQLVREPERWAALRNDRYGGDLLLRIAGTPERTRTARLRRISAAVQVAVPQLESLDMYRDERTGAPHLRIRYAHWRANDAWQSEEQFSDGTLRLIGLLWSLLDGSGPLLLEEPELSLHPEVVRHVPQMLARVQRRGGRQVLVSTHSPDILQDEGIGLDEVLVLQPQTEGTSLTLARDIAEVRELLEGGLPMGDVVMPLTRPAEAQQLPLLLD
jgi:predicted ATPase